MIRFESGRWGEGEFDAWLESRVQKLDLLGESSVGSEKVPVNRNKRSQSEFLCECESFAHGHVTDDAGAVAVEGPLVHGKEPDCWGKRPHRFDDQLCG